MQKFLPLLNLVWGLPKNARLESYHYLILPEKYSYKNIIIYVSVEGADLQHNAFPTGVHFRYSIINFSSLPAHILHTNQSYHLEHF